MSENTKFTTAAQYWKQRCMAAEDILVADTPINEARFAIWQEKHLRWIELFNSCPDGVAEEERLEKLLRTEVYMLKQEIAILKQQLITETKEKAMFFEMAHTLEARVHELELALFRKTT
jgi:hypothetical protein